jgi:hypothetical protein
MLREMPKNEGAATPSLDMRPLKLDELGITYNQSSNWQAIALLPEDKLEEHIARVKANKKTNGLEHHLGGVLF